MLQFIERMEDNAIHKYGFESKRTVYTFKFTDLLRKLVKK